MHTIGWHRLAWQEINGTQSGLRAACKANLDRLQRMQPGAPHGLRLEKVHRQITELKISWNKQEFRILFFWHMRIIMVVHFFQKTTRKTPSHEIKLAESRMKEIQLDQANVTSNALH
jgi:phage-related protein